jgi:hypothetical protein
MAETSLEQQVRQAFEQLRSRQAIEQRFRKTEQFLTLSILAILIVFLVLSYTKITRTYTLENVTPRLTEEMAGMGPEVASMLSRVAENVIPVYTELGASKLEQALPQVEQALAREMTQLLENTQVRVREEFDEALHRLAQKLRLRLEKEFPALMSPEGIHALERQFDEMLTVDSPELLEAFFQKYSKELVTVYRTLDKFEPNRFQRYDQEELMIQYTHLWLTLLDYEVMGVH